MAISPKFVSLPPKKVADHDIEKQREDLKICIKACLIAHKDGLSVNDLKSEYKKMNGEDIPYFRMGYNSIFHLLNDIPEIQPAKNDIGAHVLKVNSGKCAHLQKLISKQKNPRIYTHRDLMRNGRVNADRRKRQNLHDEYRNTNTSCKSNSRERFPPVDERLRKPLIYITPNVEKSVCTEPIVGTSQLIGDDFFLQLCIKYLNVELLRKHRKSALVCGTVESGLTIQRASEKLNKIDTMSNKLIINLGTVDIYNRKTVHEMTTAYKHLLEILSSKFEYSNRKIVLCTIPPIGNISLYSQAKQYSTLLQFNNWLRNYATENGYKLLDLFAQFTTENMSLDYQYFQSDARMVSGTSHPHVLWNYFGRQKAMKLVLNI